MSARSGWLDNVFINQYTIDVTTVFVYSLTANKMAIAPLQFEIPSVGVLHGNMHLL